MFLFGGSVVAHLASSYLDVAHHDACLEIEHSPVVVATEATWVTFAFLHHRWRKLTGKDFSVPWARIGWAVSFVGINLAVIPQFLMRLSAMPRRYADDRPSFELYDRLATLGLIAFAVGLVIASHTLLRSLLSRPGPPNEG